MSDSSKAESSSHCDVDVLIIGAGPAGIAAAVEVQRQGRSCLIVEARSRIGGRVCTNDDLGVPIDIGQTRKTKSQARCR